MALSNSFFATSPIISTVIQRLNSKSVIRCKIDGSGSYPEWWYTMEYNDFRDKLNESPELSGLDDTLASGLFWRCEERTLAEGAVIYQEGAPLDFTFGLLVSGDLIVEKGGSILCGICEHQVFGEMAYFTNERTRTATIRVGSPQAVVLKFTLTSEELRSAAFSTLRTALELETWDRFVNTSQSGREYPESINHWI
jgi:Cyclic nucleotide-binding domain